MKTTRISAICLVSLLICTLLAGCNLFSGETTEVPIPSDENAINVITNGSFEDTYINDKDVELPFNFLFSNYQGAGSIAVDKTVARTGNNSVRITGDGESRTSVNHSPPALPVEGGQTYKAVVWYKHDPAEKGAQAGGTMLRLQAFENSTKIGWDLNWILQTNGQTHIQNNENLHVTALEDPTDRWAPLEVTFTLPQEANRIWYEAFNYFGEGTVWFDDYTLLLLLPE